MPSRAFDVVCTLTATTGKSHLNWPPLMWILDSEGDLLDGMRFLHYRSVSYVLTIFEESASGCDLGRSISLVG